MARIVFLTRTYVSVDTPEAQALADRARDEVGDGTLVTSFNGTPAVVFEGQVYVLEAGQQINRGTVGLGERLHNLFHRNPANEDE